jgi:hypothetical protein
MMMRTLRLRITARNKQKIQKKRVTHSKQRILSKDIEVMFNDKKQEKVLNKLTQLDSVLLKKYTSQLKNINKLNIKICSKLKLSLDNYNNKYNTKLDNQKIKRTKMQEANASLKGLRIKGSRNKKKKRKA